MLQPRGRAQASGCPRGKRVIRISWQAAPPRAAMVGGTVLLPHAQSPPTALDPRQPSPPPPPTPTPPPPTAPPSGPPPTAQSHQRRVLSPPAPRVRPGHPSQAPARG